MYVGQKRLKSIERKDRIVFEEKKNNKKYLVQEQRIAFCWRFSILCWKKSEVQSCADLKGYAIS